MKQLKLFICSLLVTLLVFSLPVNAQSPTTGSGYQQFGNSNYYIENNAGDVDYYMLTYAMDKTPMDLGYLFKQEGVRVYITHSVPQSERQINNSSYEAYCQSATISWNGKNKITKVSAPVSIYIYHDGTETAYFHECGHALDFIAEYITGYYQGQHPISSSTEWQNLYSQYGSTLASFDTNSANNTYNAFEAFAESFRLYFVYPQQLQTCCPGVYNFITNQIAIYTAYVPDLNYNNFDYETYAVCYPDVVAAVGNSKKALWEHYVNFGKAEGRTALKIIKRKR